jgi:hypothetical protein
VNDVNPQQPPHIHKPPAHKGVKQQPALGEPRGRIHAPPVVGVDDPFRCPAAAVDTSALV